jgi:hypothetical protein
MRQFWVWDMGYGTWIETMDGPTIHRKMGDLCFILQLPSTYLPVLLD